MITAQEERKNKQISAVVTVVFHAIALVFAIFFFTWNPPDPPLPDYGVELNFGITDEGFGDLQTTAAASEATNTDDAAPNPPQTEITPPLVTPQEEANNDNEADITEPKEVITTTEDSPAEVKVTPEKKQPKPVVVAVPEPSPKPVAKVVPPSPTPTPATEKGSGGIKGTGDKVVGNNNGDKPGKVGDQGSREGSLDAKALYGNPGSGGGSSLELSGWEWESKPDAIDKTSENGRIVFQIVIDEEGNLVDIKTLEKTVSPSVENFYKKQVEELSFVKKRENISSASRSTGKITFVIRSK